MSYRRASDARCRMEHGLVAICVESPRVWPAVSAFHSWSNMPRDSADRAVESGACGDVAHMGRWSVCQAICVSRTETRFTWSIHLPPNCKYRFGSAWISGVHPRCSAVLGLIRAPAALAYECSAMFHAHKSSQGYKSRLVIKGYAWQEGKGIQK